MSRSELYREGSISLPLVLLEKSDYYPASIQYRLRSPLHLPEQVGSGNNGLFARLKSGLTQLNPGYVPYLTTRAEKT
jgi:hypothetical protein